MSLYLLPAMLKTTRPSWRMLALPNSAFTSEGDCQSACLTCSCHARSGCLASGWRTQNVFKVDRAISLIQDDSPKLGLSQEHVDRISLPLPNLVPSAVNLILASHAIQQQQRIPI